MKYLKKNEVDEYEVKEEVENIFEEENKEVLTSLVNKYYVILQDVRAGIIPPKISVFIERFKKDYNIGLSEEEYLLLKEYAEEDYPIESTQNIMNNVEAGRWQIIPNKDSY